jgi:hypothetical protein
MLVKKAARNRPPDPQPVLLELSPELAGWLESDVPAMAQEAKDAADKHDWPEFRRIAGYTIALTLKLEEFEAA